MDVTDRVTVAAESAEAGATIAADLFRTELSVETKAGKTDYVTRADRSAQAAVVESITKHYPEEPIVGEEAGTIGSVPGDGTAWVVDPIDGTNNFVRGLEQWTTSVASIVDGEPAAAANVLPALDNTFVGSPDGVWLNGTEVTVSDRTDPETFAVVPTIWWGFDRRDEYAAATGAIVERFGDLRRIGSAQAALSLLASGAIDGVVTNVDTNPWDTVAGAAMVEWAGGRVTDVDGNRWRHDSRGLVASNGNAHDLLLEVVAETDAAATNDGLADR